MLNRQWVRVSGQRPELEGGSDRVSTLKTLTAAQGFPTAAGEIGVVSGYVLKLIRGSLGLTQMSFADHLGVDVSTIQGWESGRRPLTALRVSDLLRLQTRLTMFGAPSGAVNSLHEAIEADGILSQAIAANDRQITIEENPLAATVHRRRLVNMITWPFTGVRPPQLRELPARPGRGPVAPQPVLASADQHRFFNHLLITADSKESVAMPVLRRQAIYLLGFDQRSESSDWLAGELERAFFVRKTADLTSGIAARSAAVALARRGDSDPLRYFIQNVLSDEKHAAANLAYWAYWLGEINEAHTDDGYLSTATTARTWSGVRLADPPAGAPDRSGKRAAEHPQLVASCTCST
jgi:DNA-binding transcriptional regulator YiaG